MKSIRDYTDRIVRFFTSLADMIRERRKPRISSQDFWRFCLEKDAGLFCGLYTPMLRLANGRARKPERVLAEWSGRAAAGLNDIDGCESALSEMQKAIDSGDAEEMAQCARLVLLAAKDAGITHDKKGEKLTITEQTAPAYTTDEGEAPYLGDVVSVETPAWYRNGVVIESGACIVEQESKGAAE